VICWPLCGAASDERARAAGAGNSDGADRRPARGPNSCGTRSSWQRSARIPTIRSRRWRPTASARNSCRGTIRREAPLHVKHCSMVNYQHFNVQTVEISRWPVAGRRNNRPQGAVMLPASHRHLRPGVSPDHLRRLSEGAQESAAHTVAVGKTRLLSDGFRAASTRRFLTALDGDWPVSAWRWRIGEMPIRRHMDTGGHRLGHSRGVSGPADTRGRRHMDTSAES
jgi:hypothetical protein